jgi:adenine deaminase
MGIQGIKLLIEHSKKSIVRVLIDAPSCVPIPPSDLMTPGHEFGIEEIEEMLSWGSVVALGEIGRSTDGEIRPVANAVKLVPE